MQSKNRFVAARHVEWLCQRPFQTATEWMSDEGEKWRKIWRMKAVRPAVKKAWESFAVERASEPLPDLLKELEAAAAAADLPPAW
jgi:hypothetical protein